MHSAWILSCLAALAAAQTTTVQWMGFDETDGYDISPDEFKNYVGRVVAMDKAATTYEVNCASDKKCGIKSDHPMTLVQGPETFSVTMNVEVMTMGGTALLDGRRECTFTSSSESASCTMALSLSVSVEGTSTSTSIHSAMSSIDPSEIEYYPLTVTGGVSAPTASATTSTSAVSTSATTSTSAVSTSATGAAAPASGPMATAAPLGAAAMAAIAALL
ncbi:hypothetical protein N7468_004323 [Penicillium chermesinum]|uniref:GPI anchored cell wall protein n=1 Tax=Penicillium chermesinum TaxID=63820 RepID=A0A9W9P839_9EURO|nr:uncharacterized protein N7468_004323 [Penicillium chermesinum]KAJ5239704.1 hypothetical protein N7468_004323 [Penicillium chermesinum]KAJ6166588.1 hypothetical protein N7470_002035 [Penicillium chermesinum]